MVVLHGLVALALQGAEVQLALRGATASSSEARLWVAAESAEGLEGTHPLGDSAAFVEAMKEWGRPVEPLATGEGDAFVLAAAEEARYVLAESGDRRVFARLGAHERRRVLQLREPRPIVVRVKGPGGPMAGIPVGLATDSRSHITETVWELGTTGADGALSLKAGREVWWSEESDLDEELWLRPMLPGCRAVARSLRSLPDRREVEFELPALHEDRLRFEVDDPWILEGASWRLTDSESRRSTEGPRPLQPGELWSGVWIPIDPDAPIAVLRWGRSIPSVHLEVDGPHLHRRLDERIVPRDEGDAAPRRLHLRGEARIRGRLRDPRGLPAGTVPCVALYAGARDGRAPLRLLFSTDARGRFDLLLPRPHDPGDRVTIVTEDLQARVLEEMTLDAPRRGLIELGDRELVHEPTLVTGRVLDDARNPVEGARVFPRAADPELAATTDAEGRFELRGVVLDRGLRLVCIHRDYESGDPVDVAALPAREVELALRRLGSVDLPTPHFASGIRVPLSWRLEPMERRGPDGGRARTASWQSDTSSPTSRFDGLSPVPHRFVLDVMGRRVVEIAGLEVQRGEQRFPRLDQLSLEEWVSLWEIEVVTDPAMGERGFASMVLHWWVRESRNPLRPKYDGERVGPSLVDPVAGRAVFHVPAFDDEVHELRPVAAGYRDLRVMVRSAARLQLEPSLAIRFQVLGEDGLPEGYSWSMGLRAMEGPAGNEWSRRDPKVEELCYVDAPGRHQVLCSLMRTEEGGRKVVVFTLDTDAQVLVEETPEVQVVDYAPSERMIGKAWAWIELDDGGE